MSVLEEFEKRCGLEPLTPDQVIELIGAAESYLMSPSANPFAPQRTVVWLSDRLQAVYAALENPKAPVGHRCAYCWNAAGRTDEAWRALPTFSYDDACLHAQVCEHNQLVRRNRELEADNERLGRDVNTVCANHQEEQREHAKTSLALREARSELEDLRGRKLGNADAWAEAASEATGMYDHMRKLHEALKVTIRSLLDTELPAGELRKAVGELVK